VASEILESKKTFTRHHAFLKKAGENFHEGLTDWRRAFFCFFAKVHKNFARKKGKSQIIAYIIL
jgi:hypothetical protein